ncbi:hypothetical protein E2C01_062966 [Portunus trituberculatus]|uniref:Uncharacterized protein n=1 Tax=Portunus trituberculatus TaxID=210409 RepID=A0A5B7HHI2_PORTR|nr:hypothetical protein [Portunus trituberculatus]
MEATNRRRDFYLPREGKKSQTFLISVSPSPPPLLPLPLPRQLERLQYYSKSLPFLGSGSSRRSKVDPRDRQRRPN